MWTWVGHQVPVFIREVRQAGTRGSYNRVLAAVFVLLLVSAPARTQSPPTETPPVALQSAEPNFEVVRFTCQDKRGWYRVVIDDLDVITTSDGRRLLPLLRLMKILEISAEPDGEQIAFQVAGGPKTTINPKSKEASTGDQSKPIELIDAQSVITQETDHYLPPDVIADLLRMQLSWDVQSYAYTGVIDRQLSAWITQNTSLSQIKGAPEQPLPELFPIALPSATGLEFARIRVRPQASLVGNGYSQPRTMSDNIEVTLWGNYADGRCKVDLAPPSLMGNQGSSRPNDNRLMVRWAEWVHKTPTSEIVAGDCRFGLNGLVVPYTSITGVRVSGVKGRTSGETDGERAGSNTSAPFSQEKVFAGYAPIGSTVVLYINDRPVSEDQVSTGSSTAPDGMGWWRFDNVGLPVGRMNEVRIVTTDSNGTRTEQKQSVLGTPLLFPAGRFAYIAGLGTNRNVYNISDTQGLLGGARVAYGLSDRLTLGAAAAVSNHFFLDPYSQFAAYGIRQYPRKGTNAGLEFAWLPVKSLLVFGEAATSSGVEEGNSDFRDSASVIRTEVYPTKKLTLNCRLFRYGPRFFNGQNLSLRDRQGYATGGRWDFRQGCALDVGFGRISNNLDGALADTRHIGFQHIGVRGSLLGRATAAFALDRVSEGQGVGPRVLTSLEVRTWIGRSLSIDGMISEGDPLMPSGAAGFFSGISIPQTDLYETPRRALRLSMPFRTSSVDLQYWSNASQGRISIAHSLSPRTRGGWLDRLHLRNEIGRDLQDRALFFENRIEYRVNQSTDSRLGLRTRFEQGDWRVTLTANTTEVYGFHDRRPKRVSGRSMDPESGGVQGTVFLDANANGIRDPGEPGVPDIGVMTSDRSSTIADRDGYFVLPASRRTRRQQVFLDLKTVPADYSPTNAQQKALISSSSLTEVNLGLTPAHMITGKITFTNGGPAPVPVAGLRVTLTARDSDKVIADSVTASDGSYYFGDIRPGRYTLRIDGSTVPSQYLSDVPPINVEILPEKELQELIPSPIEMSANPSTAPNSPQRETVSTIPVRITSLSASPPSVVSQVP